MRRTLAATLLAAAAVVPARAPAVVTDEAVSFAVQNPAEPGVARTVRGRIYHPSEEGCTASAILLLHGLSYGAWGWDPPFRPGYSVARALAADGFTAVAIDELGYNSSDHPNGYTLTVQSYAAITDQIVRALRAGTYTREGGAPAAFGSVSLVGHSAGTEISELTAGLYGGVDALVATAYTHSPSQRIVTEFVTGDMVRAAQDDYEYFGDTPQNRAQYMYDATYAEDDVIAADTLLAVDTPSGEILSISNQPSRWAQPLIRVPVLLVLAERDILFPVENGAQELALFASSPDATLHVVPQAGHSFMLHPNAAETNAAIAGWLGERVPRCG